ncbi:hypothetical protein CNX70_18560 [Janthinobacterium svalbardensis]|uniref:Uncharacterized protein n=1 Tax=Janthinobacterium svalbardensis TaxID=368607 RepID=A0A290WZA0_9BURK|nr:hypothetical protein [Janthinobacterium svalbardensis]ATD61936.1 hypothetical protein CNX70_18560 [Janthinobacterium svalbardensis]
MLRAFPSLFRLISLFLVMTIMSSGMVMAAYVCPQLTTSPVQARLMAGMPCADMDKESPAQCAEYKSGAKASSDHLSSPPVLAPISVAFITPASALIVPTKVEAVLTDIIALPGTDPPYLQTQRLRI